jgi:hypothetical protein
MKKLKSFAFFVAFFLLISNGYAHDVPDVVVVQHVEIKGNNNSNNHINQRIVIVTSTSTSNSTTPAPTPKTEREI